MKLAVIGAGWAGLAAAVAAVSGGHSVTVCEAARTLGGRARTLLPGRLTDCNSDGADAAATLDNGQHIMIGAYRETLALMHQVGVEPADALLAMPLTLRFPDGYGIALPDWPAPLDAVFGIVTAAHWNWRDKASLLRIAARWRLARFGCAPGDSVSDVCRGLTARVLAELIEPLCVSALNTPATRSSGRVFLRVVRDALFGKGYGRWGGSNLLLPRRDLGKLLPDAAFQWLTQRGATVRSGHRVEAIAASASTTGAKAGWLVDGRQFDAVILACPPWEAARLVQASGANALNGIDAADWAQRALTLEHEAIATVYATSRRRLELPMLALRTTPEAPAQFVFDRGQLGGPDGLLAFVVSASQGDRDTLQRQVIAQAHGLGWTDVRLLRTVLEKRATFACTPHVKRPAVAVAPGLLACGDYVDGPYPATLEGAVRSGLQAASLIGMP